MGWLGDAPLVHLPVGHVARVQGHGRDRGEQRDLLRLRLVQLNRPLQGNVPRVLPAQAVAPLFGDGECPGPQPGLVGDEQERLLPGRPRRPAHQSPDCLAKEQLGGRGGGEDANSEAGDVDALGHHPHRHDPRLAPGSEPGDAVGRFGIVGRRHDRSHAQPVLQDLGDAPGMVLVGGDHQAPGAGLTFPDGQKLLVGLAQDVGEPFAIKGVGGPEALARPRRVEGVLERVGVDAAVRGTPLHHPVDAGEVDGPHDAAVA